MIGLCVIRQVQRFDEHPVHEAAGNFLRRFPTGFIAVELITRSNPGAMYSVQALIPDPFRYRMLRFLSARSIASN
jgi:hypothetical protein